MIKLWLLGVEFRFLTIDEAEQCASRTLEMGESSPVRHVQEPGLAHLPFRPIDSLDCLREFFECFDEVRTIPCSRKVLLEISAAILHKDAPSSFPEFMKEEWRVAHGGEPARVSDDTLKTLDHALTLLSDLPGFYGESWVGVFALKGTVVLFVGQPVLYAQSAPIIRDGRVYYRFGYAMGEPLRCLKLDISAPPEKEEVTGTV